MIKKQATKNVLAYDPLAWLDESEDKATNDSSKTDSVNNKASNKKTAAQKTVKKTAVKKKNANKKSAKEKSISKKIASKKSSIKKSQSENEIQKVNLHDTVYESGENSAYGFFESTPHDSTSQSTQIDESTHVINLGVDLTIRSVAACKSMIDETISNGFDIKLTAAELQKIDTAGLQLIYSLNKTLEKTAQVIQWESSNAIINEAAQMIGMNNLIETTAEEAFGFFTDEPEAAVQNAQQDDPGFGFF